MMNRIKVQSVIITDNKVDISYIAEGKCREYLNFNEETFWIEYSIPIKKTPVSIAVIPFCANVLPLVWLLDATLEVPELDFAFYNSIEEFKNGYIKMYPTLNFGGKVEAGCLINNNYDIQDQSAVFFSGGVDAFSTLIAHIEEKPILLTLWGADVKHEDINGWEMVSNHIVNTASEWDLETCFIKTNFRKIVLETALDQLVKKTGYGYWYGFQHGIGIISHAAPIAFTRKIRMVYLASSYTKGGQIACASSPTIDNFFRISSCQVRNDQSDWTRQDKIINICNYVKEKGKHVQLRVCWESEGGGNCCHCEKCYRTILGILAEGENPLEYGFSYTHNDFQNICKDIRTKLIFNDVYIELWKDIQDRFIVNKYLLKDKYEIDWIYSFNFEHINRTFYKSAIIFSHKIHHFMSHVKAQLWRK